jgi:hypothetical protein
MNKEEVMQTYKKHINKINEIKYLKIKNHSDKIKLILQKIQNNNLNIFFVFFKTLQNKLYNDIENVLFIPFFYLS